jgi:uncharacterized protein (TIRG00374 family)
VQVPALNPPVLPEPALRHRKLARAVWTWTLSIGLAAVLLYFALRGVEWRRVGSIISGCRVGYLLLACCFGTSAYIVRALRWRVLLNAQETLGVGTVLWASSAGYLGNNFLPARAGELVRITMISSRSRLSKAYVLTTAVTERVADMLVLVVIGSSVALGIGQKPVWLARVSVIAAAIGTAGIVFLAILPRMQSAAKKLVAHSHLGAHWQERLGRMVDNATAAMRGFRNPSRLFQFTTLSVIIWLLDATGAVVLAYALGMRLSLAVALLLLTGLGVGSALPSTPGAVGIFQFVAVTVLVPFHFTPTDAIAFILVAQAAGYVVVTCLGLIGLWQYRLSSSPNRA